MTSLMNANANFSNVIPLYLTNPIAAKGKAPIIHIHDVISNPHIGLNIKYKIIAMKHPQTEKTNCLSDNPKYTLSV